MKTAVFLIWSTTHSIGRYLLVANELSKLKVKTIFLDFEGNKNDIINDYCLELKIKNKPECVSYNVGQKPIKWSIIIYRRLNILLKGLQKKLIKKRINYFNSFNIKSPVNDLEKIIKNIKFDNKNFLKITNNVLIKSFKNKLISAENFIKVHRPDCVFYDIELVDNVRAFLFAAKQNKVKIISMQHAQGNSFSYATLPLLADYYVAYSRFNYDVLKHMGVKKRNILLTGNPDNDIIYRANEKIIKTELIQKHNIDFSKKIIIVPLKPISYCKQNKILIDNLVKYFSDDNNFCFLIKPHPSDNQSSDDQFSLVKLKNNNFRFIDPAYPIFKLFKICEFSIFYFSSCIVESVLVNSKAIVIKDPFQLGEHGVKWPDWNNYKAFHLIDIDQLPFILKSIKKHQYNFRNHTNHEDKKSFIEQFSYNYDSDSSLRISQSVKEIIYSVD